MAEKAVSQPIPTKNIPVDAGGPKHSLSSWVMVLLIFLITIILVLAAYIVYQNKGFQKAATSVMSTETPSPTGELMPGADWKTYKDEQAGFILKYPPTVLFNVATKGATQPLLSVSVDLLDAIPEEIPLGMDRKTALIDKAALEKGEAKTIGDFAASDALVRIGSTYNGRMTSVLSRFEVCSVLFTRSIIFYPNNYRVIISFSTLKDGVIAAMPEFFTTDPTNCGEQKVWNRDIMGTFMPTLAGGKGKGAAQTWYDTFDAIIKTITLIPVSANALPTATTAVTPAPTIASCEVSDAAFCNVLADIKNSMAAKNYNGVIAYQTITSVTCDPDGMAISVCDGMAKGVVKEGYDMGYNESEGGVQTRDQHLASLASYVSENGPFIYKGSLQSGDKGIIEYLNADASKLLVFYMKRSGATWRFQTILVGGTWGDSAFINLDPSLLDRVQ